MQEGLHFEDNTQQQEQPKEPTIREWLERVVHIPSRISIYKIQGITTSPITRYVISTPQTREICNDQQLMGTAFSNALSAAVEKALIALPEAHILERIPDYENNVVCLLRGSLNFDVRKALARAFNYNNHSTTYLVSKREQDSTSKKWIAQVQNYKDIALTRNVVFYLADVIRTGKSLKRALDTLRKVMMEEKKAYVKVRRFIVFTIGCKRAEEALEEFDKDLKAQFPEYEGTTLVYFEARFKLANEKHTMPLVDMNTDLLKKGALVTPEFYLSQYDAMHHAIERCVLYDGGSRAFDIFTFKEEIQQYWAGLLQEANKGYTLFDALYDRFPDQWENKDEFMAFATTEWRWLDKEILERIWNTQQIRWTPSFIKYAQTSQALKKLCIDRLEANAIHWK